MTNKTKFNKHEYRGCSDKEYDLNFLRKHCGEGTTYTPGAKIINEEIDGYIARAKIAGYEPEVLVIKIRTFEKAREFKLSIKG